MRADHFWNCACRVVVFGWMVKKGGKEYGAGNLKVVVSVSSGSLLLGGALPPPPPPPTGGVGIEVVAMKGVRCVVPPSCVRGVGYSDA